MKRYVVFIGEDYYPRGGFNDFVMDTDDKNEAIKKAKEVEVDRFRWAQVYDTHEMKETLSR